MTNTQPEQQTERDVAFEFVRSIAVELTGGNIELPSFPEIAIRVRRVLSDPKSSIDQVARVVGSEPALAARVVRIANSASLNRSGRTAADLRTAINRMGFNMLRSAATAFAMSQIRDSNKLKGLEPYLSGLWKRSMTVAACAFVLARATKVNPDEAMLGGMMHGIGKLYLLTRATRHPELFADTLRLDGIINDWHAAIGKAILENWDFSEEMCEAVGAQDEPGSEDQEEADLRDIIATSIILASYASDFDLMQVALEGMPAARRLGVDGDRARSAMQESAAEISALTDALGG